MEEEQATKEYTFTMPSLKNVIMLIVALGLISLGVMWLMGEPKEPVDAIDDEISTEDETVGVVWNDTYDVRDQDEAMTVIVRNINLQGSTWLVVHEHTESGAFGNALGAGLFSGEAAFAEVPLLRGTEAGRQYSVLVYEDDGDRQFDLKKDLRKNAAGGAPISVEFFALKTTAGY